MSKESIRRKKEKDETEELFYRTVTLFFMNLFISFLCHLFWATNQLFDVNITYFIVMKEVGGFLLSLLITSAVIPLIYFSGAMLLKWIYVVGKNLRGE